MWGPNHRHGIFVKWSIPWAGCKLKTNICRFYWLTLPFKVWAKSIIHHLLLEVPNIFHYVDNSFGMSSFCPCCQRGFQERPFHSQLVPCWTPINTRNALHPDVCRFHQAITLMRKTPGIRMERELFGNHDFFLIGSSLMNQVWNSVRVSPNFQYVFKLTSRWCQVHRKRCPHCIIQFLSGRNGTVNVSTLLELLPNTWEKTSPETKDNSWQS